MWHGRSVLIPSTFAWPGSSASILRLLLATTLVGILTVEPIKPIYWYQLGLTLLPMFGGHLILVDALYAAIAALILLNLSSRALPFGQWPWRLLLYWIPIAVWSLVSVSWAPMPTVALSAWLDEILLSVIIMCFGYSVGYRRLPVANVAKAGFLLVMAYVSIRSLFVVNSLDQSISSTWFCLLHPLLLLWLAESCESNQRSGLLISAVIVMLQIFLHLQIPQRMYVLSLLVATLTFAFGFYFLKLEPVGKFRWRSFVAVVLTCLTVLIFAQFSHKPASHFVAPNSPENEWYLVFFQTERYQIFQYWISQGIKSFWIGAGLHYWNPLIKYDPAIFQNALPPELIKHAHNYFLNVWLQLGFIGLLAQLSLLVAVTKAALGKVKDADKASRRLAVAFCVMLVACFGRNMSDDGFHAGAPLLFWLLTGFVVGYQANGTRSIASVRQQR